MSGDRTPFVLTTVAFALGLLIILGAAFVPLVSVASSSSSSASAPASASGSAGPSSTPTVTAVTQTVTRSSQETLLAEEGASVLATAAVPAGVSLAVGGLLLAWSATRRRRYLRVAWTLAALLMAAALVEFVTFLIGLFVLPTALLLLIACATTSRPQPQPGHLV